MNYLCANRDQEDGTRPVSVYYNVYGLHDRGFQMMPGQWSPETTKNYSEFKLRWSNNTKSSTFKSIETDFISALMPSVLDIYIIYT